MSSKKSAKNESNKGIVKMTNSDKDVKSLIEKILGDISKTSATKQIMLGATSGWITGYLSTKIGRVIALAVGGGIILLQVANHKGYIKINWDKVNKNLDKVADKVEEQISGEGPSWINKAERFIDRKLDKTEDLLKSKKDKAKRWYHGITGDCDCKLKEIDIFLVSFFAGVAIGMATS